MHVLLSDIWCKSPISVTVSYLMQLTCAPVLKSDENMRSFTFILKGCTFSIPCVYKEYLLFYRTVTYILILVVFASQANEFPIFGLNMVAAFSIWSSVTQRPE